MCATPDAQGTGDTLTNTNANKSRSPPPAPSVQQGDGPGAEPGRGRHEQYAFQGRHRLASTAGANSLHHEDDDHDVEADEVQLCRPVSREGEALGQE